MHSVMVAKFQWKPFWLASCHPAWSTEWLDCHQKSCELWHIRTGPFTVLLTVFVWMFIGSSCRWAAHAQLLSAQSLVADARENKTNRFHSFVVQWRHICCVKYMPWKRESPNTRYGSESQTKKKNDLASDEDQTNPLQNKALTQQNRNNTGMLKTNWLKFLYLPFWIFLGGKTLVRKRSGTQEEEKYESANGWVVLEWWVWRRGKAWKNAKEETPLREKPGLYSNHRAGKKHVQLIMGTATEHVSIFSFPLPSPDVVTFRFLPWSGHFLSVFWGVDYT